MFNYCYCGSVHDDLYIDDGTGPYCDECYEIKKYTSKPVILENLRQFDEHQKVEYLKKDCLKNDTK